MTDSIGYPIKPDEDNVAEAIAKHIQEFIKVYSDLESLAQQIIAEIANADVDKVDGCHADNTANNIPVLNSEGKLTQDTTGTANMALNIPTSNVGGNIWIE